MRLPPATSVRLTLLACMGAIAPVQLAAQQEPLTVDLATAVRTAERQYPLAVAALLQVDSARTRLRQAEAARILPRLEFNGTTGLVPAARGTILDSPDDADSISGLGPFFALGVSAVQPIYTFGKIGNTIDVARSAVTVREEDRRRQMQKLALTVAESFWVAVAADEARLVTDELRTMYEDFLGRVGDQVEDPDSTTDAADLYEAQSLRFSVDQQYYEAIDQGLVARRRLQILMDTDPGRPVEVTSPPAPTIDLGKEPLPRLFALAREQDPGLRTALAAVQVAEAAVRQAGSEQRPSLFLVAGLEWSHAANRTDQSNPFVYDPYNRFRLGAAVDLRWDLNFRRHGLRSQERRIERDLAQARANAVAGQVLLRVEEAYREVITSDRLVEAALASRLSARAWLHISIDHWELGIGSLSRVVRAYERFFQTQGHVIRNELRRNLALTNLAVALGSFDLYLRWMNDGNVAVP